ncbi:MAG: hypothetical protein K8R36_21780 [Planctomycetales bacterium]|nr:hypothetical protein [Planctomycetales bacterium]
MKFSIRDLFLVTVIVALASGWWVDRSNVNARLTRELEWRARLENLNDIDPNTRHWAEHLPNPSAPAPIPPKD